ncbi:hypothetical protein [Embleya hyalina]|uniref:Uncharacterized protein n=1 Tax=Embleya hyalina TaxID=516124 RepID=A0A401YD12_9ACTN|nr:hypothetical protein [Embleya hyalina]GCD92480.1 hypothetical protein EHYA_00118 [Embleya hyalina]
MMRTGGRVVVAGLVAAVVVGGTAVWRPWGSGGSGREDDGAVLSAPGRVYPVLADPYGDRYNAKLSPTLIRRREAFRQRIAEVLQRHLPPPAAVAISEATSGDYRVTVDGREYRVGLNLDTVRVAKHPPKGMAHPVPDMSVDPYTPWCRPPEKRGRDLGCVDGSLPDGGAVAVHFPARADLPPAGIGTTGPSAVFRYRGAQVGLTAFADLESRSLPPITGEQWLAVVRDPSFLELVDYWRAHPTIKGHGW